MKFVYYFNGNDFDYEIDDNQIKDFLVDKMLEEGKMERNKDNVEMARFMINRFNLYEDEQILEALGVKYLVKLGRYSEAMKY